jgi:hypothetical protein
VSLHQGYGGGAERDSQPHPRWKLELEKQQQATLVNQIIDASPTCVVLCQAVYNNKKECRILQFFR